jgi:HAD superfamily phosphoserine phosphatase-like hydrolase
MQPLAIYDMDKTITRKATFPGWLRFAGARLAPMRMVLWPGVGVLLALYGLKRIDRAVLKERMHALLLGATIDPVQLDMVARDYAARLIADGLFPLALRQIEADRAAGCRLVLATASFHYYAGAVGKALGFDAVIATGSRRDHAGRVSPLIDGENCYGPAKLRMIEAWLVKQGLGRDNVTARFYSDHPSDACVLDWADQGFAVNPDDRLRAMATERGWPILW